MELHADLAGIKNEERIKNPAKDNKHSSDQTNQNMPQPQNSQQ
jgi:hypothetical protein